MSMTVALACGHGLQLRNGPDIHPDQLPETGPWTFYPPNMAHETEVGDLMTCLVCQTSQEITGISPDLIPMTSAGKLRLLCTD
jgi:hypothetical protein